MLIHVWLRDDQPWPFWRKADRLLGLAVWNCSYARSHGLQEQLCRATAPSCHGWATNLEVPASGSDPEETMFPDPDAASSARVAPSLPPENDPWASVAGALARRQRIRLHSDTTVRGQGKRARCRAASSTAAGVGEEKGNRRVKCTNGSSPNTLLRSGLVRVSDPFWSSIVGISVSNPLLRTGCWTRS